MTIIVTNKNLFQTARHTKSINQKNNNSKTLRKVAINELRKIHTNILEQLEQELIHYKGKYTKYIFIHRFLSNLLRF